MNCQRKWQEFPPDVGENSGRPAAPGPMKLLFISSDQEEVAKAVKQLLFALVRCLVSKEGPGWGVWVQDKKDVPRALNMFALWAKPRPLPPWSALLELETPVDAREARVVRASGNFVAPLLD